MSYMTIWNPSDSEKENTVFTNRYCTIENEQCLFIRMPIHLS